MAFVDYGLREPIIDGDSIAANHVDLARLCDAIRSTASGGRG